MCKNRKKNLSLPILKEKSDHYLGSLNKLYVLNIYKQCVVLLTKVDN